MSRGAGRCQRAVLARLEASEGGVVELRDLVRNMEIHGFLSQNVLRAVRGLRRVHAVCLSERGPGGGRISLPEPVQIVGDDEIAKILQELTR